VPPIHSAAHHPVFRRFENWRGIVGAGTQANWLGVLTDVSYADWGADPEGVLVEPSLPPVDNEEYPEWIDVLDAACRAGERFAMVELGAGWGRWLTNAAAAYRQLRPHGPVFLVGVEAEPTHFRWLGEHLKRNGVDGRSMRLFEAAVAGIPGHVVFHTGDPAAWYGQAIKSQATWRNRLRRRRESGTRVVRAITLAQAFDPIEGVIDLVDLDVQGAEADVLENGARQLDRVRCVHIGTHSAEQEDRLRVLFTRLGWRCRNDYACGGREAETWWGGRNVDFQDGVQTWLNPALVADDPLVEWHGC
jgi:FkbM family methyltransferase